MNEIRIEHFHATHRAPDAEALARIAAVQQTLLAEELEAAFAPYAPDEEIIVVKRLASPAPLAARHTDRQSARNWSAALAEDLARTLRSGRNVLRFRNRMAAQAAFGEDALSGSNERDWAWKQLGMLPQNKNVGVRQRLDAFLALASRESETLLPLLRVLSNTHSWLRLIDSMDMPLLEAMTRAVLQACGGDHRAALPALQESMAAVAAASADAEALYYIVPRGPLLAALQKEKDQLRRLWQARLAALLTEPQLGRRRVALLEQSAARWLVAATAHVNAIQISQEKLDETLSASETLHTQADTDTAQHEASTLQNPSRENTDSDAEQAVARSTEALETPVVAETAEKRPEGQQAPLTIYTEYGGLLFILPLLEISGTLALLEDEDVWGTQSWPLALHRFATHLLPLAADDPAVLAFCGLLPGDSIPHPYAVLNDLQQTTLETARECIQQCLSARLPEDWQGPGLITRLARRSANIYGDAGWIEARFSLREVSLDLRRAALDLDPGFISWLGIVLRYSYE